MAASKAYIDSLGKLARHAHQGTWGGCTDIAIFIGKTSSNLPHNNAFQGEIPWCGDGSFQIKHHFGIGS
ncbi:hypothetical protein CEXT_629021 [Caerostris extrusa]|uniref:Uncharacterized protein n=1 Tax=Caerostris extrusa TaxID=172846 RepID=A0AAV4P2K2_CAEEX|nr:hypothetical protein CEXT_629021 [Caerostris extrusa]